MPASLATTNYTGGGFMTDRLAGGRRVSPALRNCARAIAADLLCITNHLMAGMALKTGYTFSPSKKDAAAPARSA